MLLALLFTFCVCMLSSIRYAWNLSVYLLIFSDCKCFFMALWSSFDSFFFFVCVVSCTLLLSCCCFSFGFWLLPLLLALLFFVCVRASTVSTNSPKYLFIILICAFCDSQELRLFFWFTAITFSVICNMYTKYTNSVRIHSYRTGVSARYWYWPAKQQQQKQSSQNIFQCDCETIFNYNNRMNLLPNIRFLVHVVSITGMTCFVCLWMITFIKRHSLQCTQLSIKIFFSFLFGFFRFTCFIYPLSETSHL